MLCVTPCGYHIVFPRCRRRVVSPQHGRIPSSGSFFFVCDKDILLPTECPRHQVAPDPLCPPRCARSRLTRLLKLSGRLLQTVYFHLLGPDQGLSRPNQPGENNPLASSVAASPTSSILSMSALQIGASAMGFHRQPTDSLNISERILDGAEVEGTLQELVAQLSSSARFDAANRYLEVRYIDLL